MSRKRKNYQLPTLTMQAGTAGAVAVVDVTGIIGWDDNQCLAFADQLKSAATSGAASITLRVNSPGGDVFSALNMYDAIRSCKLPVRAEVHGLAASAATLLVMAADTIAMSENAKFMVHQPFAGVWGNPDEIMNYAKMLIQERERMFSIYGERCGKPWAQVSNDHLASVYYTAEAAIAYGFVNEIIPASEEDGEDNDAVDQEEDEPEEEGDTENGEEADEPEAEEGDDEEEEEDAPAPQGLTGRRTALTAATGRFFGRIFGASPAVKKDPNKRLLTENRRLEAMNRGLQAQVKKMKGASVEQQTVIHQLVDKQVTARLAELGIAAGGLPASAEQEQPPTRQVHLPTSRQEFMDLPIAERLNAVAADPAGMKKFLP